MFLKSLSLLFSSTGVTSGFLMSVESNLTQTATVRKFGWILPIPEGRRHRPKPCNCQLKILMRSSMLGNIVIFHLHSQRTFLMQTGWRKCVQLVWALKHDWNPRFIAEVLNAVIWGFLRPRIYFLRCLNIDNKPNYQLMLKLHTFTGLTVIYDVTNSNKSKTFFRSKDKIDIDR